MSATATSTRFAPAALSDGRIDVWWIDLERADASGATLTIEERIRSERFKLEVLRRRYLATRGAVRKILAAYLDCRGVDVKLSVGAHGKPMVVGGGLRFNLAHSGDLAVLAVSSSQDVGIDCEAMRGEPAVDRIMSNVECAACAARPSEQRAALIYRLWTRKEALAKATGRGLTLPLNGITVFPDDDNDVTVEVPPFGSFTIRDLDAPPGYAAALCALGTLRTLRMMELSAVI